MSITFVNSNTNEKTVIEDALGKNGKPLSIIEYAEKQLDTFDKTPFGEVDSLVLSQLAYVHMDCLVGAVEYDCPPTPIKSLFKAEYFSKLFGDVREGEKNRSLLTALRANPRFRDIGVNYYINILDSELEKQFCAMTFFLPDGNIYIAYRGTDSTFTGWKEDYNLLFGNFIPGHHSALHYVEVVAARTKGGIYIGGHSKGGHLALYGASFAPADIQSRIIRVYNHDGPGLPANILGGEGYNDISFLVDTTLPRSSLFGLIFSNGEYRVVKSSRLGIMQHDPFSWEISGSGFVWEEAIHKSSVKMVDAVYELIQTLSEEDRQTFKNTIFDIFSSSEADSFQELSEKIFKESDNLIKKLRSIDRQSAENMKTVISEIIKVLAKNILSLPLPYENGEYIKQKIKELIDRV